MTEKTKIIMNDKELIPRELTVEECEELIEGIGENLHPLEMMCPDQPIPAQAIATSCGLTMADLDQNWKKLTESEIKELFSRVRARNPFLARSVEVLAEVVRRIQREDSKTSGDPAAA